MRRAMAMVVVMGMLCAEAGGELTPEQITQAKALIQQFTSPEFATRQQAVEKLIGMGPDVVLLVKKTLADATDAEVKLRCEMVLKGIKERFGADAVRDPNDKTSVDFGASRITLEAKDMPLSDVLQAFAEQSGNAPIASPGNIGAILQMPVTLSIKDKPYWEALDMVCRQAGMVYEPGFPPKDRVRLRQTQNRGDEMGAYCGSVVIKLDRVERSDTTRLFRRFRTDQGDENQETDNQKSLGFHLRYFTEDRLPVLSSWMEFTAVTTPDGVNRLPKTMPTGIGLMRRPRNYGPGVPFAGQGTLYLQKADAEIDQPVTIEGKVSLEYVVGRRELEMVGVRLAPDAAEKTAQDDGVEITLKKIDLDNRNVTITLALHFEPQAPVFTGGRDSEFGFALVDPKGKRYRDVLGFNFTGNNGSVTGSGGGAGYRLNENIKPGEALDGTLKLTFVNVPAADGDWSIVFAYPERCEIKEFPFKIENVPVP